MRSASIKSNIRNDTLINKMLKGFDNQSNDMLQIEQKIERSDSIKSNIKINNDNEKGKKKIK